MGTFRTTLSDHVLRLRFGAPDAHNPMTDTWFSDLEVELARAEADPAVRCLHLSAEGRSFSSGGDLRLFLGDPLPGGALNSGLARCLARFETFSKPIVAVVHSSAIGGGSTLLLHCDLVYAETGTTFHLPFTRLGIVPELGSTLLLPLLAGHKLASELMLLGKPFDADTALRAGLINAVLDRPALDEQADAAARTLAGLPPKSLQMTKQLIKRSQAGSYAAAWRAECEALDACFGSAEMREACTAILEKRKPDFSRFD